jgi:protoporphyrinogen oxidase
MTATPPPVSIASASGKTTAARQRTAVIGGGISGLTCALRLAEAGDAVTLFEGGGTLGGLGNHIEHDGHAIERFYHCMLPSDGPLLSVLESLGITDRIYWKPSSFGYFRAGKVFPLNTPVDLLKFAPLSVIDRIRVGVTGAYGRMCSDKGLDDVPATEWLGRLSGKNAFETFWKPMLQAKFGDRYHDVPALWFWSRFNREKGESKGEVKGYIRGGYKFIADTFAKRLGELGASVRLNDPVVTLDLDEKGSPVVKTERENHHFDRLVITTPWPSLEKTLGSSLRAAMPKVDFGIDYQGVINCLLFLRRPLTKHYWVATPQPDYPFDGVIETSTLTDVEDRGDRHVVYLTKYMHRTDPRFREDEDAIATTWWQGLKKVFPDLRDSDLETRFIFRAPFVEPLYTRGYMAKRPPETLVADRVFLSSTVQVYPTVTSWNGSVTQAEKTLEAMKSPALA